MKAAAIWSRVSTQDQRELSLDGQVERCKAKVENMGYTVPPDRVLAVVWSSLDLYSCPQFQELRQWVKAKEIQAVAVLDRDRLNAQGLQRLTFIADCKDAGVELVLYQGSPMLEGTEGQIVEMVLAIGKERSVERAQTGAKQGLRDRAVIKRLPPSPLNPYGYTWSADRTKLQPTKDWPNAQFICQAALRGATQRGLRLELHHRGILSPQKREWWGRNAIHTLLTNPIYGGRFYALRWENVEPKKRKGNSSGKSSTKDRGLASALHLPNIIVESPPFNWEEWEALQQRQHQNKLLAQRNAKRDYLLRGLITCETHQRRFVGHWRNEQAEYVCGGRFEYGVPRCARPIINEASLVAQLKDICRDILTQPEIIEAEIAKQSGRVQETVKAIGSKLAALEQKEAKTLATETNLLVGKASGDASPEAYERALALMKAQKTWIAEERERLAGELALTRRQEGLVLGLGEARGRLLAHLERGTNADWREVFTALSLEVKVNAAGGIEVSLAIPITQASIVDKASWGWGRARPKTEPKRSLKE